MRSIPYQRISISRYQLATGIAILFHAIGFIGILVSGNDFFVRSTPVNLLLMLALLFYTQRKITLGFTVFMLATYIIGVAVELIGTSTGLLFGNYEYGTVLGPSVSNVPLIIGVNWIIVIFCVGTSINILLNKIVDRMQLESGMVRPVIRSLSVIVDGAIAATAFDWLIEPVAVKLGYWQWQNNQIPFFNYVCWFAVSVVLLLLFQNLRFDKRNKFALNLLLIQAMFFLLLRTFL